MPTFGKVARCYTFQGVTGKLSYLYYHFQWLHISIQALRWRLRAGMSLEQAITMPLNEFQRTQTHDRAGGQWVKKTDIPTKRGKYETHAARWHAAIIAKYTGHCSACGAHLLKQSLAHGVCKGGCQ